MRGGISSGRLSCAKRFALPALQYTLRLDCVEKSDTRQ